MGRTGNSDEHDSLSPQETKSRHFLVALQLKDPAWVWLLAQELLHATCAVKKKKKRKRNLKSSWGSLCENSYLFSTPQIITSILYSAIPPQGSPLLFSYPSQDYHIYITYSLIITKFISPAKNSILSSRLIYSLWKILVLGCLSWWYPLIHKSFQFSWSPISLSFLWLFVL